MTQSDDDRPASLHSQMVSGAHLREGWDALATLFSGVLVFGLPAWWLSSAVDQVWITPVGLVVGMGAGIAAVWVRYGVHRP
jgi:hypothetical protein